MAKTIKKTKIDKYIKAQASKIEAALLEKEKLKEELPEGVKAKIDLNIKPHMVAFDPIFMHEIGNTFRYGANKHGLNNFRKMTPEAAQFIADAALRHMYAFLAGEYVAGDSDCAHLAHAAANLSMLYRLCYIYGYEEVLTHITNGDNLKW